MAQTKRKSASTASSSKKSQTKSKASSAKRNGNGAARKMDAIALLKQDHREVEEWFARFEKSRAEDKKEKLAQKICMALTVHAMIEEEIFYPAFLEAADETDTHHEADVEHDGARELIAQMQSTGPSDASY